MSYFNLLEEPWILVMSDEKGTTESVSLMQLFQNASQYKRLAGEIQMQNFAVLRLLLAILHTVFSRFDNNGNPYPYLNLNEKFKQTDDLDEDDFEDHQENLMLTWTGLWNKKSFPQVVIDYLNVWKDRFYLFDDTHPFYQVTKEEQCKHPISRGSQPTKIYPKTFNRFISESSNKIALFSPKQGPDKNKNRIYESELARWLILFQGVVGTGDKAKYETFSGTNSKGWIYDLGGVALQGNNLFETLLLNLVLLHPEERYQTTIQNPCWEQSGSEIIAKFLSGYPVNNLAELYTNWSRAIYINPVDKIKEDFAISTVKLPEINHQNQFLEPMTLWKYRTDGPNKNFSTPQKHNPSASFWRSFGTVFLSSEDNTKRPGIIDWLYHVKRISIQTNVVIESYGMEADGNATSWLPVEECYDTIDINEYVLADLQENGWVERINNEVEKTKEIIGRTFKKFVNDVKKIRNLNADDFTNKLIAQAYYSIDQPFRFWLSSLEINQNKDERIKEWRIGLQNIIKKQADFLVSSASNRDFKGIFEKEKSFTNIATAYNEFDYWLRNNLGLHKKKEG